MAVSTGCGFEHGVEDEQQLAHGGGERDLGRLAVAPQAPIELGEHRVAAHCAKCRHVEHAAHCGPAAAGCRAPVPLATLVAIGCNPDQSGKSRAG
jgi:hypothetical protein